LGGASNISREIPVLSLYSCLQKERLQQIEKKDQAGIAVRAITADPIRDYDPIAQS
jgi:hypothetical protein